MSELSDLFEAMKNASKEIFEKHGECVPVFITLEPPFIIPTPWRDFTEKNIQVAMIKALFKEHNVKRFGFAFEAWMSIEVLDDDKVVNVADIVAPSERPDRQECIMVIAEEKGLPAKFGIWPITRDKKGRGIIGKFKQSDGEESFEQVGAYRNMLGTEILH